MDGRTLMEIMQSPNFSMWGPAEQAFNLGQKKNQADLQTALGTEQRAQALHPLEIKAKEANIRQSDAAAGYSNTLSSKIQDDLKLLGSIPMDQRVDGHIAKMKAELTGDVLKQTDAEMEQLLGAAGAAAKNGGQLPLGYTLQNPQHATYFKTPQGAHLAMQLARSYFMTKPKEMYAASNDERAASSAANVARIGAEGRLAVKNAAGGGARKAPKTSLEAIYFYQELARNSEDPVEQQQYLALSQKAQQTYENELVQKAQLAAQARLAGGMDIGTLGNVPTNPLPGVPGRSSKPQGSGKPGDPIVLK